MNYGDLDLPPNDIRGALARSQVIAAITGSDVDRTSLNALIAPAFNRPDLPVVVPYTMYFPTSDLSPACMVAVIAGSAKTYAFFAGVANRSQGNGCWAGYLGNTFGFNGVGESNYENLWYRQSYLGILAQGQLLPAFTAARRTPWVIAGHSAGGPIGLYFYRDSLVYAGNQNNRPQISTFGSPSPGMPAWTDQIIAGDCAAWMISDDPVPLIPPPVSFAQRWWAGVSYGQANRLVEFGRWPGGINLALNGAVLPGQTPLEVGPDPVGAVQSWLAATAAGVSTSHSIGTYVARLAAAQPPAPAISQPVTPVLPQPPVPAVQAAILRRQIAAYGNASFQRADVQNSVPVQIPATQLFTVQRMGRVYSVYFRGSLVSVAPRKRGAHQLARVGNAFLRSLQSRAGVDTAGLTDQFAEYLAGAVDPSGQFAPVMIDGV